MKDTNYTPLDFAGVHGTPDNWLRVDVYPDHAPGQWRIERSDSLLGQLHPAPDLSVVSDVIKFSGSSNIVVSVHGTLPGGREDCVDINNRSKNITVQAEVFAPRGRFVATVKGGSKHVCLRGSITSGRETDIDLGNWSDQSGERTEGVSLNLRHVDGRPVRVRVLHAHTPSYLLGGPYDVDTRFKGAFRHVFRLLKKIGLA